MMSAFLLTTWSMKPGSWWLKPLWSWRQTLQPLGVLVEHRVDDVNEGLVAREEAVAPGQQVALEPALAQVLAQDLHHAAVRRDVLVADVHLVGEDLVGDLEQRAQSVGRCLVGAEDAKVALVQVAPHHVAQELAEHARGLARGLPGPGHVDGVVAEVRQPQVLQQYPTIGVGVGAHAPLAPRRQLPQLRDQAPRLVEELLGPVAPHPLLELLHVLGVLARSGQRNLVRAVAALHPVAVDDLGPGPALGRPEDDHRPPRPTGKAAAPRPVLDGADLVERGVEGIGHPTVHGQRFVALDEVRLVAVADEQVRELFVAHARQQRRVGDLVAVEVQDRQHSPVAGRVEEFVRVPARGQRPRLRLAVAHHAAHDEVRVVVGRTVGVHHRVAQLAALVDRAGRLRRDVAGNASRKRELLEQLPHALDVLRNVGVNLAVRPLQVGVRHQPGAAVSRPGHVDDAQVPLPDRAVEVDVDEVEPGRRAPVTEEPWLDVLPLERLAQQGVVHQVDLPDGEVVGRPPVGVHLLENPVVLQHGGRVSIRARARQQSDRWHATVASH
jgi:hypothetical protein